MLADEFEPEFDAMPQEAQDAILAKLVLLEREGPRPGRSHADTLQGSRHANMKELRCTAAVGTQRVAFAFDPERAAIVLVGGDKREAARSGSIDGPSPRRTSGSTATSREGGDRDHGQAASKKAGRAGYGWSGARRGGSRPPACRVPDAAGVAQGQGADPGAARRDARHSSSDCRSAGGAQRPDAFDTPQLCRGHGRTSPPRCRFPGRAAGLVGGSRRHGGASPQEQEPALGAWWHIAAAGRPQREGPPP